MTPNKKTTGRRRVLAGRITGERRLLELFEEAADRFPSLRIALVEGRKSTCGAGQAKLSLAEVAWSEDRAFFAVQPATHSTPKAIHAAAQRAQEAADQLDVYPMVATTYLSEERLLALHAQEVSGLDLCGNGILVVPNQLFVFRTGYPNLHPERRSIRNVYRGASSIVGRAFLLRCEYPSSEALLDEITARGGKATRSTISKACSALADDLIIERVREGRTTRFRLLQPDKLLARLAASFAPPEPTDRFIGKLAVDKEQFQEHLLQWRDRYAERVVRTGSTSCQRYAAMAREPIDRYYCSNLRGLLEQPGDVLCETERFPDVELLETANPTVYFDCRDPIDASPLQSFLELASGDKRQRETAEQIRQRLLDACPRPGRDA